MGYLPEIYTIFKKQHPQINDLYEQLSKECHEGGPLDEKTRRLVKLGIAIGQESEGGIRSHTRKALEAGASKEEIHHVAFLSLTTGGFPKMIAAFKRIEEVLTKET